MFRIIKLHDDTAPANMRRLAAVQEILRTQFPDLNEKYVNKLSAQLRDPLRFGFRSILFIAENTKGDIKGFAWLSHAADLHFAYLDYVSAGKGVTGGGIGGALYERVREEALDLGVIGIFFECLPDDPKLSPDQKIRAQNSARLRFYERYGARPITNTGYETPLTPSDTDPPYLVYDDLGQDVQLNKKQARAIVKAILERKYADDCSAEYVQRVLASINDDPVCLRDAKYISGKKAAQLQPVPRQRRIAFVVNQAHDIHHVKERGYVQSPVRISVILRELEASGLFEPIKSQRVSEEQIKAVHDADFVDYLRNACAKVPPGESVYPYVFPIRNQAKPPKELPLRAGYYCIDTFTPLNKNAYLAARGAVDCAVTAGNTLLEGYKTAYALVRPPGHHAERRSFGGFCYFNSAAIAAHQLSRNGRVALLDIDYHHGNGTQDIFYARDDVFTVSIHGNPRLTYPYFSGFEDETGEGQGQGYNLNFALPENIDGERYRKTLRKALDKISNFAPHFLVVSLGLDTAKGDPTGSWTLGLKDFFENGHMISSLNLPTLIVQEGGYRTRTLGKNAREFFSGFWAATHADFKRA